MNLFVITDNKWWLNKAINLFLDSGHDVSFFCYSESDYLFEDEIISGLVKPIDLEVDSKYLIANFDLGISIHCKQIFPHDLVERVKCINIHPGLNPYNRGWFPHVFSILNKMPAGVTIHLMDEKVDHGEIIVQKAVEVFEDDTSKTLYGRILNAGFELFQENFHNVLNGSYKIESVPSDGNYNSIHDYGQLLEIDLDEVLTMREAIDYLRAMTHPPYRNAYFFTKEGEKIFVSINLDQE